MFKGYLMKAVKTGQIFDSKWLQLSSYKTTPNQREAVRAIRDDNTRELFMETAEGTMTSITFTSMPCNLATKKAIQRFFTDAEAMETDKGYTAKKSKKQRRIQLEYWDDETNKYEIGYFYRADIQFTIKRHTEDNIYYEPFTVDLVEYGG